MNISLCMIMKNEEKNIGSCLDAVKNYGFEIVLVDTGSTDETIKIAKSYTDKVYHFDWCDDFSAARNYSISKASNDWVFILDCDETVTQIDADKLDLLTKRPGQCIGNILRRNHFESNGTDSVYVDNVPRLFNKNFCHYEGIIHEQVRPFERYEIPSGGIMFETGIICEHSGYVGSESARLSKKARNEELLLKELKDDPDNPYIFFQLGQCYNGIDDEKALMYYSKGLSYDVDPNLEYVQMMVIAYGYALLHLQRYEEALDIQGIYDEFASSADFITLMGIIYMRTGNYIPAMGEFLKATMCPVSHTQGSNSFIPYYNMGCINELLGEVESAKMYYKKCGDFKPAVTRLEELL